MKIKQVSLNRRRFITLGGAMTALVTIGGLDAAYSAESAKPRIGVIGSGKVGGAIGRTWVNKGYEVMFSARNLDDVKKFTAALGPKAHAGTPKEAAAFGDVLLIAVPYGALPDLGKELKSEIKGKIVIDACNPFPTRDGEIAMWAREKGAGLASAELLAGARIVRAFNAIGAAVMGAAHETPGRIGMPIAGDDKEAIAVASRLIRDVGYEPVLIGGLAQGKHLLPGEPLAGEHSPEEIRQIAAKLTNK